MKFYLLKHGTDLGNLVYSGLIEKFKGKPPGLEDYVPINNEPFRFSSGITAIAADQILREATNGKFRVPDYKTLIKYHQLFQNLISDSTRMDEEYTTSSSIVIYNENIWEEGYKDLVDLLRTPRKKLKFPLVVTGLGVEPSSNELGYVLTITDYTEYQYEQVFKKDGIIRLTQRGKLVNSKKSGLDLKVDDNQDTVCCIDISEDSLSAFDYALTDTSDCGRLFAVEYDQKEPKYHPKDEIITAIQLISRKKDYQSMLRKIIDDQIDSVTFSELALLGDEKTRDKFRRIYRLLTNQNLTPEKRKKIKARACN